MKKLFFTISILFLLACSDSDLNGYTESIIKGSNTSNLNSLSKKDEPQALKKTVSTFEEDFSSLDEDELREKLLNTYPWPKAEGTAAPNTSSSSTNTSSGSTEVLYEDTFTLPYNPRDGRIVQYQWKNVDPVFEEPDNYPYGFDRDPTDKDPFVYISVETGAESKTNGWAKFVPHVNNHLFDVYKLLHEKFKDNPATVASNGKQLIDGVPNLLKEGGTYTLYGCYKKCDDSSQLAKWKKINKYLKILPYEPKTKNMIYVQIDGETPNEYENGFTHQLVTDTFNTIYAQAVVKSNFIELDAKKDLKIHEELFTTTKNVLIMNMTNPDNTIYTFLKNKAIDMAKNKKVSKDTESPYWHIVFAINKMRKEWELGECIKMKKGDDYDLSRCGNFEAILENPQNTPQNNTKYYLHYNCAIMNNKGKLEQPTEDEEVEVRAMLKNGSNFNYYIFRKGENKAIKLDKCLVLYTEDGYPIVPSVDGAKNGAGGISLQLREEYDNEFKRYDGYLPYGSIIYAPRGPGKSGLYVLMHELGHSFGLSDVSKSNVYKVKEKTIYNYRNTQKSLLYSNDYASSETNMMSWQAPAGRRIRYRNTPIVCTAGTRYYKYPSSWSSSSSSLLSSSSESTYERFPNSIERPIANGFENQWECIRDCFKNDLFTQQQKDARIMHWEHKDWCLDNDKPLNNKNAKHRFSTEEEYKKDYKDIMEPKVIPYN